MIKELLKDNILICDGAMGTYYSEITGNDVSYCEFGNLNDKETIKRIHKEYIEAGAKLIRTNTFSANTYDLGVSLETLMDIIKSGINLAKEVTKNTSVLIGASIGPIKTDNLDEFSNEVLEEYKYIVDCFLENGIDIFIFETFSNYNYLKKISEYIKYKNTDRFILTQFAVKPDGFTRDGLSVAKLIKEVRNTKYIDAFGFNCGSGPAHILEIVKKIDIENEIVSVLPNAGYPEIIHERTVYPNNPLYFAKKVNEIRSYGVSIIGGCCGTNPSYIKQLTQMVNENSNVVNANTKSEPKVKSFEKKAKNTFKDKLENGEFVVAIELSAPIDTDISRIIDGAKICKENNIDLVTVPDSPMSKVRADSTIISSKIKREIGIEAMPHICCRDKNTNAIRSSLIGSHIENIRNILAITGDPISDASKVETKSVFNLNSFRLIELIESMNEEIFKEDSIYVGGALNLNVLNKEVEYNRMMKKIEKGAKFFLTQPIYDDNAIEFLKMIKERTNVKILAGLLPVVSYRNAMFLNNELPGVTIPDKYVQMFSENMSKEEAQEIGVKITVEIGKKLKNIADGLYFITPFNRVNMLIEIIKQINA
ncbi:bifunctional homocysteine S-methyltransferase/methylenetetrahydrofolate reductase [Clostridium beijerinckii]|jgi:homocysteine S-methyltransferase|uniref:Bifunctional homocysteine S-methyltransferase/methylenetetrahydrofolate reductase n=1 Tax=Clostridium beijerinckii TaxID=1520 RepID=A0A7X9SPH3_CLOBE|nr:bifunctional homocysteine S-methyltransferase/methylenetetrahydrofolate reductase [Clostridium beijerinckii]MCI1577694.1 bifunctional homocysteine S-methyltransferase/methylenetetrahydrofolate reductase [Clostridium beijerinckii]MCI1584992.1 bifunctional homocysteine S-methyltransferase/methylenetetrahydrofolate reductase [Clostridium beijerinckii]MCI1622415.1 bifunctional homocysteine S-methyltransferase/methylenetetrahydrofolate reductase [Clostridium beijerinckii]NMF05655.1 bifunctional h